MNRAVFLDRDGVVNRVILVKGRPYPPASVDELELLPGVVDAINALKQAGFRIIVVTNQPDVGARVQRQKVVEAMHERLRSLLPVDDIKVCYHVDEDMCQCRKPKPGMLLEAALEWSLNLKESFIVGDRWRDIEAGKAAGCKTILIGDGYIERRSEDPDFVADSLFEASILMISSAKATKQARVTL